VSDDERILLPWKSGHLWPRNIAARGKWASQFAEKPCFWVPQRFAAAMNLLFLTGASAPEVRAADFFSKLFSPSGPKGHIIS
jgi:hypothetical protein